MDIEQFIQFERARRDCYKLLAACFYQPQKSCFWMRTFLRYSAIC